MILQRTIKYPIRSEGIALHSGNRTAITLLPAPVNHGIVFKRVDVNPPVEIPANHKNVSKTVLSTTITSQGLSISTVEHLLAVLHGLALDNLIIEINGDEVPTMDGSSSRFIFLLQAAGIVEQTYPKRCIIIDQPLEIVETGKWVRLKPFEGFKVDFTIAFDHKFIKTLPNSYSYQHSSTNFIYEISRARTFGFNEDVQKLKEQNLALGGSLKNAAVIGEDGLLNKEGLRYPNEFVRHKILDAIGDLYMLGCSIVGAFEAHCSGHDLNNKLIKKMMEQPSAWHYLTLDGNHSQAITSIFR